MVIPPLLEEIEKVKQSPFIDNEIKIEEIDSFEPKDVGWEDFRHYTLCRNCLIGFCQINDINGSKILNRVPKYKKNHIDKVLVKASPQSNFFKHYYNCRFEPQGIRIYEDEYYLILKKKKEYPYDGIFTPGEYLRYFQRVNLIFTLLINSNRLSEEGDFWVLYKKKKKDLYVIGFCRSTSKVEYNVDAEIKSHHSGNLTNKKVTAKSIWELKEKLLYTSNIHMLKVLLNITHVIRTFSILPRYQNKGNGSLLLNNILNYYANKNIEDNTEFNLLAMGFLDMGQKTKTQINRTINSLLENPTDIMVKLGKKFGITSSIQSP